MAEEAEEVLDLAPIGGVKDQEEAVLSGWDGFGEDRDAVAAGVGCGDVLQELVTSVRAQRASFRGMAVIGDE